MDTEAFTIRSDSKKVKQLDQLASQMDRSLKPACTNPCTGAGNYLCARLIFQLK